MSKLKLRRDYLGYDPDLLVNEHGRNVVSVQVGGCCHEPYRPALTTKDLARIVSKILEENPHFALTCLTSTMDGAILCLKQVIPEQVIVNIED